MLYLSLIAFTHSQAQKKAPPLTVGDPFPMEILLQAGIQESEIKGRAVLIDFWSINCSGCYRQLHKMQVLQAAFPNDLFVIGVAKQSKEIVDKKYKRINIEKPSIRMLYADSLLTQRMPHRLQPHFVWVTKGGRIAHITDGEPVTRQNIAAFVKNVPLSLPRKIDAMNYNPKASLLHQGEGKYLPHLQQYSFFMQEVPGLDGAVDGDLVDSSGRRRGLKIVNAELATIYKVLSAIESKLFIGEERPVVWEVNAEDSATLLQKYCYENWNRSFGERDVYPKLKKDLEATFPFTYAVEARLIPVYALVRNGKAVPPPPKDRDGTIKLDCLRGDSKAVVRELRFILRDYPIVDSARFNGEVQLNLDNMYHLPSVRTELQKVGFDLVPSKATLTVLVIRRKEKTHSL